MKKSRSAQIAVALAATFAPALAEAQGSDKPMVGDAISRNAAENNPPPIEIESSLSSGATWFGNEIRRSPDSYGSNAQKLVASLFDGEAPKASGLEKKEMVEFLYELGEASRPVAKQVNTLTASPEITAVARRFHSHMAGAAKENSLVEIDDYLGLVAGKQATAEAIAALSGSASSADRAKLLLLMARNTYNETSKHNSRSFIARQEAAKSSGDPPIVGAGSGTKPVASSYLQFHVNQGSGNSYCATACALMFALDEAGIVPDRVDVSEMIEQLASIHSEQVGKGREGIYSHHMLELAGLNPVQRDYTELNRVEYGKKNGSEKGRREYVGAIAIPELIKEIREGNRAVLSVQGTGRDTHAIIVSGVTKEGILLIHDPGEHRGREMSPRELSERWYTDPDGSLRLYAAIVPARVKEAAAAPFKVDLATHDRTKRDFARVDGAPFLLKLRAAMGSPASLKLKDGSLVKVVGHEGDIHDPRAALKIERPGGLEVSISWRDLVKSTETGGKGNLIVHTTFALEFIRLLIPSVYAV